MAAKAASTALVVATRAAVDSCGLGHEVLPPRSTETDVCRIWEGGNEMNYTATIRETPPPSPTEPGTQNFGMDVDDSVLELDWVRLAPVQEPRPQVGQ